MMQPSLHRSLATAVALFFACLFAVDGANLPDPDMLTKAAEFVTDPELKKAAAAGNVEALYTAARQMHDSGRTKDSKGIWKALADAEPEPHVNSQVALAFAYLEEGKVDDALTYFALAGEGGPHHGALYNAGRLLVEQEHWVPALAYLWAAVTLPDSHPEFAQATMSTTVQEAYVTFSEQLATLPSLTIEQTADLFLYSSPTVDLHSSEYEPLHEHWTKGIVALHQYNKTCVETDGQECDRSALEKARQHLTLLHKHALTPSLSALQTHFLLQHLTEVYGPLAATDDRYNLDAAEYYEAWARSKYCYAQGTPIENIAWRANDVLVGGCFNVAISRALMYYRRASEPVGVKRVWDLAKEHPIAATHYKALEQTPLIFRESDTTPPPFLDATPALEALSKQYRDIASSMTGELAILDHVPEGRLVSRSFELDAAGQMMESRTLLDEDDETPAGWQRVANWNLRVRSRNNKGAGAWAEYGPLYDGLEWDAGKCTLLSTLCNTVQTVMDELCQPEPALGVNAVRTSCGGTTAVVTLQRLRPGSTILAEAGPSSRKVLEWCLAGCDGVKLSVGGQTRAYVAGQVLVYDESLEHSVVHTGRQDRIVLRAVLK